MKLSDLEPMFVNVRGDHPTDPAQADGLEFICPNCKRRLRSWRPQASGVPEGTRQEFVWGENNIFSLDSPIIHQCGAAISVVNGEAVVIIVFAPDPPQKKKKKKKKP